MAAKTQEIFVNAFLDLLKEKEYTKISIIDIANKCNSTRQTFYYHFKNIDEMTIWAIDNDTKLACQMITETESWSEAGMHYMDVLKKYQALLTSAMESKKALFIYDVICNSVDRFVRYYVENKSANNGKFTDFMYASFKYLVVGLAIEELKKPNPDFKNIMNFVHSGLSR